MILNYHEIVPEESSYLYSIRCERLKEHLSCVSRLEFATSITFDDGHASQYLYARELLAKYSVKAVFFVCAGFISSRNDHMSWEELRSLRSEGHSIQSHGWSHRMLTLCTEAELMEELTRAKEVLEDRLGAAVDSLSFPGGAVNKRVLEASANAGYTRVYDSNPWAGRKLINGIEMFGRLNMRRTLTAADVERIVRAEHRPFAVERLGYSLRRAVRMGMGERLYHTLWCALAKQSGQDDIARSYGADSAARSR